MGDLTDPRWIIFKGVLFAVTALLAAALLIAQSPTVSCAALLAVCVWSACRFYFFLFHVLEKYVDPGLRYDGLLSLARRCMAKSFADVTGRGREE